MASKDKNGQRPEAPKTQPTDRAEDRDESATLSETQLDQVAGGRAREEDPDMGGQVRKK